MAEALLLAGLNAGAVSVGTATAVSSAMSLLPSAATVLTAGSALGSYQSGQYSASSSKAQAAQYELSAKAEELKGREQANKIRQTLQATLAAQNAAFAARGVSTRTGTPLTVASDSRNQASQDISNAMFNAGFSAEQDRLSASQYRTKAKTDRVQGYIAGLGALAGNRSITSLVS